MEWLFGSRTGREILVALAVAILGWLLWGTITRHYVDQGYAKCQAEHTEAKDKANTAQTKENEDRAKKGAVVAADSSKAADAALRQTDEDVQKDKKEIHDAYQKPPRTVPVAPDSCVHPIDGVVQDRINTAVDKANAAAR